MKIKYLGTAAYEGVPSIFCNCSVCRKSKDAGGRNIRSRSQAVINDELLLDFNADTATHAQKYGLDFNRIRDCLITHSHCDHLYEYDIESAREPYSHDHPVINFYAAKAGYEKIKFLSEKENSGITATLVTPYKKFTTSLGYEVLPLEANHDELTSPVIYEIEKDGKKCLYAHDTGYFPENSWAALKKEGRLDFASLDCTGCIGKSGEWRNGHMTFGTVLEVIERMKREGIADERTVFVVNHFSHNGGQTYDEMSEYSNKFGIITSYDGIEFEF